MSSSSASSTSRMPSIFVAHGSPYLVEDPGWASELASWARSMPRPRSILVVSAHWIEDALTIGATSPKPLVYDFNNFPARFYELAYRSPGAPELAERVDELVGSRMPVRRDESRGLDHGVYAPLIPMYPDADIPVLQISLPTLDPARVLEVGRALAPLRDEGTLIIGSGFLTHNMSTFCFKNDVASSPPWALEHDAWCAERLAAHDVDALVDFRERAPFVSMAHPTDEHFVPVLAALGASRDSEPVQFPITGFAYGTFTRRSVQFG